jgi:hypothetical protein
MYNRNVYSTSKWQKPQNRFQKRARFGPSQAEDGFRCKHCNNPVSSSTQLSGVRNRNHCPYCLWSRHLDLQAAGDRLSACKSPMNPVGLTVKATWKKYGACQGELMLIHECPECGALSINRIAADDNPERVYGVFEASVHMSALLRTRLKAENIQVLGIADLSMVQVHLFGQTTGVSKASITECSMGTG